MRAANPSEMVPVQHDGFDRLLQLRFTSFQAQQLDKDLGTTLPNSSIFRGQRAAPSPRAGYFSHTVPQLHASAAIATGTSARSATTTAAPSVQASAQATGLSRTVCWQFRDSGSCSRGQQCRFLHEINSHCHQPALDFSNKRSTGASAVPWLHQERSSDSPAANRSPEQVEEPHLPEQGGSSPSTVRSNRVKTEVHIEVLAGQEVQVPKSPAKNSVVHQSFMPQAAPSNRPQRSVPNKDGAAVVERPRLAWQGCPVVGKDGERQNQPWAERKALVLSGSDRSTSRPQARSSAVAADSNPTSDAGVPRCYIRRPLPPVPRARKRRERRNIGVRPLDVQTESAQKSRDMQSVQHRRMKEGLRQLREEMTKLAVVFEDEAAQFDATVQEFSETIHHLAALRNTSGTPRLGWCTPSTSAGTSEPASPEGLTRMLSPEWSTS